MTEQERLTTRIVPPIGDIRARIAFIGEAPGSEEDAQGEPFIGSAGQLLNRCLVDKGIPRHTVLLHNVFQQRPPGNQIGYYFKDKSCRIPTWEGQEHIDALEQWLTELRDDGYLNLVVALGAIPLKVLTGKLGIMKYRGSMLPCSLVPGLKVYPTFHPSFVNRLMQEPSEGLQGEKKARQQNALPLFLTDLERIKTRAEDRKLHHPKRNLRVGLSLSELLRRIEALNQASLISCDIETLPSEEGEGPLLWCIGFSPSPDEAFTVPFIERMHHAWPLEQEAQLHQAICKVFLNPNVRKVFQNGAYDLCVLGRYYGYRVAGGTQEDTMLCHHASYPYLYKGLHILTSIYTDEPYYKDEGKGPIGSRGDTGEFLYNCKDCAVTREIFPVVRQHAKDLGTWEGYRRTMDIQPSLLGMMIRGVRIDLENKERLAREFGHKVRFHEDRIYQLAGKTINLNSSQQKQALLYGELGLKIQFHPKSKKATTDKDALQRLRKLYPDLEILEHLIERSKYHKLHKDYTEMQLENDGRVRTSYGLVSTWRLSSSESHFGAGGNLQNIPKRTEEGREIRKLFIPDDITGPLPKPWSEILQDVRELVGSGIADSMVEGRKLMVARDLSQAEARVVAWEAEDLQRIELFLAGWDVHWYNARILFSIPEDIEYSSGTANEVFVDPITNQPHTLKELRNIGKTVVHAGNYGMGPRMLQTILAREGFILQFMTCRKLLTKHKARNPMLLEWQRKIREKVEATRRLVSSIGRVREFMGRMGDGLYKSAYAFSPQNTVGEILEVCIQRIHEGLPEADCLLNVHDEVVMQCNPWDLKKVLVESGKLMEYPLEINGRELLIPSDASVGVSWGDLKEVKV
jgi:uracil-DNA glycosylase family 4